MATSIVKTPVFIFGNAWTKVACNVKLSTTSTSTSKASKEENPKKVRKVSEVTALKKGTGYRSSFSGLTATVFGSTGCMGRLVCNRLGKIGSQVIIPYHRDHYDVMRLKVCGDLGQILFTPYHLKDEDSIRRAMQYSKVVVNLVGKEYETRNFSYHDINVTSPARLARIAKEMGVERFIHISSLNAKENPQKVFLPGGSKWLKTKWQGENAVREEFPDATIFRAADFYGHDDSFINFYLNMARRGFTKTIALWKRGDATYKMPLDSADLTSGIMAAIKNPNTAGVTYEAFGPETFALGELIDWMYIVANRTPWDWGYKRTDLRLNPTVIFQAAFLERLFSGHKFFGRLSIDKLERSHVCDDPQGLPNLRDLGVETRKVFDTMPEYCRIWKTSLYEKVYTFREADLSEVKPIDRYRIKEIRQMINEPVYKGLLPGVI